MSQTARTRGCRTRSRVVIAVRRPSPADVREFVDSGDLVVGRPRRRAAHILSRRDISKTLEGALKGYK